MCVTGKNSFVVKTLRHYNFGPSVVFEPLKPYVRSVVNQRPREATRGHETPREGPWRPNTESSPSTTPPGLLKLRLFGEQIQTTSEYEETTSIPTQGAFEDRQGFARHETQCNEPVKYLQETRQIIVQAPERHFENFETTSAATRAGL